MGAGTGEDVGGLEKWREKESYSLIQLSETSEKHPPYSQAPRWTQLFQDPEQSRDRSLSWNKSMSQKQTFMVPFGS